MSSHEASQQAYKIAEILKADTMDVIETPHDLAEKLGKMGSDCPSWPETLQTLNKRRLLGSQAKVELLLYYVAKKETHKKWMAAKELEDACAQIALYGGNFDSIENNNAS